MAKTFNLVGQRFGRLLVLESVRIRPRKIHWRCACDCGNTSTVWTAKLRNGNTQSCGCMRDEMASERKRTHAMSKSPEYRIWQSMKDRCGNPTSGGYRRYGGRGIKVCERWLESFENFFSDMGKRPTRKHSINRINNDGNYDPDNCEWATGREQSRNTSRNRFLEMDGTRLTVADWSLKTGIRSGTIGARLKYGWSVTRALTESVHA